MLDIHDVENSPAPYKRSLKARKGNPDDIDRLLELNTIRKRKMRAMEELKPHRDAGIY
jgi:seryl-tRNA synthetase